MQTLWKPYLEWVPPLGQMRAAVGAGGVGGEAGELFYHLFGGCGRHRFCFIDIVLCGCRWDMMGYGMGGFGSMGCAVVVVRKWNLPGR